MITTDPSYSQTFWHTHFAQYSTLLVHGFDLFLQSNQTFTFMNLCIFVQFYSHFVVFFLDLNRKYLAYLYDIHINMKLFTEPQGIILEQERSNHCKKSFIYTTNNPLDPYNSKQWNKSFIYTHHSQISLTMIQPRLIESQMLEQPIFLNSFQPTINPTIQPSNNQ